MCKEYYQKGVKAKMAYETIAFQITGVVPLLMHNGQLADPLNKFSKEIKRISGKRAKTDADFEEMARLEFLGGLYLYDGAPCIPGEVIEGGLCGRGGAARKVKRGKEAVQGLLCVGPFPLDYDGPKDAKALWEDGGFALRNSARVKGSRVMRTRPLFGEWGATIEVQYNAQIINRQDVIDWMKVLGAEIGIMDWRPKFGRFEVEVL